MNNIEIHKENLLNKITAFLKRKSLLNISVGILKALFYGIILFAFLILLEALLYFPPVYKMAALIGFALTLIFLIITFIFKSVAKYLKAGSLKEILKGSHEIGNNYLSIKDNLLNSIQLIKLNSSASSKSLANAAFEETFNKVRDLNFSELLNYSTLRKYIFLFCGIILLFIVSLMSSQKLQESAFRLLDYNNEYVKPNDFGIEVLTKNEIITKGSNLDVQVKSYGIAPEDILISIKSNSESEFIQHRVRKDSNNIYTLTLRNIQNSFKYFAHKDNVNSAIFNISVTALPIIKSANFEIIPPSYSRLPKAIQNNNGNITALKGSRINFKISSTKKLTQALRITNDEKFDTLDFVDKIITDGFNIANDEHYYFKLFDDENNFNENPIQYAVKVIQDSYPEISILKPEQISLAPSSDIVSISYSIKDDFGFSKLSLRYSTSTNIDNLDNYKSTNVSFSKRDLEQNLYYNWDISRIGLRENDVLSYYLEIFDNDMISGPKKTRTPIYQLRIPSLDELFAEAENNQESAIEDLTETLKEAAELKNEMEQIQNELKQNEEKIDWNEKERIEETTKRFENLADKIKEVQEKLENMRENMTENNLLSEETMQKYNELQDLMDELNSEELKKAMQDMQNSLEQLMRDKVQQSLENLAMNEKMFQKSIERTLNLLKKIQIEQKMDEVIKRTEKINEDLSKLSNETKESNDSKNSEEDNNLAEDQKSIDSQIEKLNDELEKLKNKMSEVSDSPLEQMKDLKKNFDEQKNQELSKEAIQQLQESNKFDALKKQEQLSSNMQSMQNQLQQMQEQMQQQSQQMVMQNMLKAIDNIIGLSKEQESLKNETEQFKDTPNELLQKAQTQMEMKQNLDNILKQLSELSQKSFAITPEMGEALGKAKNNMNNSISGMQNRNSQQSLLSQMEAMKNMNEAALFLQNSLQNMMQEGGQGSGGMMSMMQQLQQMAQQQMGLNKMTQMMKQGQLSMQQQAQLQRLAQEQGAIQKSLQELNREAREAGDSKKISSNLEKILSDMNEVISGLNTKKVDDDLIKAQEKILSKLLDAQTSLNERDFEKNRESLSGKNFNIESPNQLDLNTEQAKDALREELLKSINEGYSKDYENLIRRYFEKLNNKSENNNN